MAASDWITLEEATAGLPDPSEATLADLPAVISAVSQALAARYPRAAAAADFVETFVVQPPADVRLRKGPVLRVARVAARVRALLVVSRTAAAARATAEATATGVVLRTSHRGVDAETTVAFADAPALDDFAALVSAEEGWEATAHPSWANHAAAEIAADGPVLVPEGGQAPLDGFANDLPDPTADLSTGVVRFNAMFPTPHRHPDREWGADHRAAMVRVWYRAGNETVPADAKRAAVLWCQEIATAATRPAGIKREQSDDYEYELSTAVREGPPATVVQLMRGYQPFEIS